MFSAVARHTHRLLNGLVALTVTSAGLAVSLADASPAAAAGLPLLITPTRFDFGEVRVGETSAPQKVTVVNRGSATVVLNPTGGAAGATFPGSSTCSGSLAPGASCQISYSFKPSALGLITGSASGTMGAQAFLFNFTGTGIPAVSVTPTGLDFGDVPVAQTSPQQSVNIKNLTSQPVPLNLVAANVGNYGLGTDCPATLAPGATCHLNYSYTASTAGLQAGTTNITVAGSVYTLNLRAFGRAVTDNFLITPTAFDFGEVPVGSESAEQIVNVKNVSASTLALNLSGGGAGLFGGSTTCPASLPAGGSCQIIYRFAPTATGFTPGSTSGTVGGQAFSFVFRGQGISRFLISPTDFDFGDVPVGVGSEPQSVTVTNKGATPANLAFVGGAAGAFGGSLACPVTLAPGASCTIQYQITPAATGTINGSTSGSVNGQPFSFKFVANGLTAGTAVAPRSPTPASATLNGQQALVQWTAPVNNGNSPITDYVITNNADNSTLTAAANTTSLLAPLAPGVSTTFTVRARNAVGISLGVTTNAVQAPASSPPAEYVPLTPERLLDTRSSVGYLGDKPGAGQTVSLQVTQVGAANVPADASAVVVNVTATEATADGYVTVYPCGGSVPDASNLNVLTGGTTPNLVVTKVGIDGTICLFTQAGTHLLADIAGYFPAGSPYVATTPERLLDTRRGLGYGGIKPAATETVFLTVTGVGVTNVPADASAVILNVTGTEASGDGYVTVYPCGDSVPGASSLNLVAGGTTPNLVVAKIGTNGRVCLYTYAGTHLIADIAGYFPAASTYTSLTPERLLDTRNAIGYAGTKPAAGETITVKVTGVGAANVPANASAVVLNVTATEASADGYVTVFPCGESVPSASNVNVLMGATTPNLVIAKVGTGGEVCLFTYAGTHVLADIAGYFPAPPG